ncbi:uncharacterized protein [Musca autumnalis]|uniref:uncharacterized protein n=1 Tax=Musca autumnalis TaxID=221902 RepID=UPI003CF4613E
MYFSKGIGYLGIIVVFALMTPSEGAIKCLHCNSNDNADCVDGSKVTATTECGTDVTECVVSKDGDVITRGCLESGKTCDGDNCKKCTGATDAACNTSNFDESTDFQCIVCRSDENADCWNNASKVTPKNCRTGASNPQEGCFHGIWNGVAIRGCYIDADAKTQATCSDANNNQCKLCHTSKCNVDNSSGAQSISVFVGLIAVMLSAIWYTN